MTIKEQCITPLGAMQKIDQKAESIISTFLIKMENPAFFPADVINEYKPYIKWLEESWTEYNNHSVLHGRKIKKVLIKSMCDFSMDKYILEQYGFTVHHNNNHTRMSFSQDKLYDLSYMATALLFVKYGEVYSLEVKLSIFTLWLDYFLLYDPETSHWTCSADDIRDVIFTVLNTNMESIQPYIDKVQNKVISTLPKPSVKKSVKIKPQCAEDLTALYCDDMTQTEWIEQIMIHWHVKSKQTVYNWFKEFGIETRQYGNTPSIAEQWRRKYFEMKEKYDRDIKIKDEIINRLTKKIELFINN